MKPSRVRWICSGLNRLVVVPAVVAATMLLASTASAQVPPTSYTTTTSATTNWVSSRWSLGGTGPTTNWVNNADAWFGDNGTFSFASLVASSGTAQLGNVTTGTNTTISFGASSNVQKIEFGGATKTFTIGQNSVANFGQMTLQDTVTTGTAANGIVKAGAGTLVMGGGTYTGGFTLNAGNVVATTNNLFSTGSVTIAGGAIGTTLSQLTPVITTGGRSKIDVTGDFQIGLSGNVGGNNAAANYQFTTAGNGFDLNGSTRKITIGTSGTVTLGQAITNGRLTLARIDGGTGTFVLSASNSLLGTQLQDVSVIAQSNNFVFGLTGTVTLSGTSATSLSVNGRTLANNFTIDDSAGTKRIAQIGNSNAIISGTVTNSDNQGGLTLGAVSGQTLTFNGPIVGGGTRGITIGSVGLSGTVIFSGSNSYTGGTTITAGSLQIGVSGIPAILGTGGVAVNGGTLNLNGKSITVGALSGSSTGVITNSLIAAATLTGSATSDSTYAGVIQNGTGAVSFVKQGSGVLTLSGSNNYTGGTTLSAGVLALGNAYAIGTTGTVAFGGGTLQYSGSNTTDYSARFSNATNQQYRVDTNGQNVTLASALTSSGGSFTKLGSGTLTLSGANTYTAGTTLNDGVLALGSVGAIGSSGTISFGGGTLQYSGNNATDYSARFSNAASQQYRIDTNGRNVTLASALTSLGGSFTKLGSGTLTLSGSNAYSGGTTVSAGAILGTALSLQGNITNNALVTFNQTTTSGTYSGVMSGTGSFRKAGGNSLTIGANQTYTGETTVDNGTLVLAGNLASGTTTIANGATLMGSGTTTGILSVDGFLKPGASGPGSLRAAGITLSALSETTMNIAGSATAGINYDTVIANSGLTYGGDLGINFDNSNVYSHGTSFSLFQAGSFDTTAINVDGRGFADITAAGNAPYSGLTFTYSPADAGTPGRWLSSQTAANQYLVFLPSTGTLVIVPEPSTWAMTLASVGFAGWMARRKKLARKRRVA